MTPQVLAPCFLLSISSRSIPQSGDRMGSHHQAPQLTMLRIRYLVRHLSRLFGCAMVFLSALSEYCLQREKQHRLCIPAPRRQSTALSRGTSSRSLVLIQMHQKPPSLQCLLFCKLFDSEGTLGFAQQLRISLYCPHHKAGD